MTGFQKILGSNEYASSGCQNELELTGLAPEEIRRMRRAAIQLMYQFERNALMSVRDEVFTAFCEQNSVEERLVPSLRQWVSICLVDADQVDEWVSKKSKNWSIDRLNRVDLAILRVCTTEFLHRKNVKASIVMAEAAEIAKEYGTEHSQSFVHGILDAVYKEFVSTLRKE